MKRLVLRLSITAVFLACGVIAIAQSLKSTGEEPKTEKDNKAKVASKPPGKLPGDKGGPLIDDKKVKPVNATEGLGGSTIQQAGGAGFGAGGSTYGAKRDAVPAPGSASGYGLADAGGESTPVAGQTAYGGSQSAYGSGGQTAYGGSQSAYGGSGRSQQPGDAGPISANGGSSVRLTDDDRQAAPSGASGYGQQSYGQASPAANESAGANDSKARLTIGDTAAVVGAAAVVGGAAASAAGEATSAAAKTAAKTGGAAAAVGAAAAAGTAAAIQSTSESAGGYGTSNTQSNQAGGGYGTAPTPAGQGDAGGNGYAKGTGYGAGGYGAGGQGTSGYGTGQAASPAAQVTTAQAPKLPAASPGETTIGNGVAAATEPTYEQQAGGAAAPAAGLPGDEVLEGAQRPALTVEKIAPREIQVGAPAKFEIFVKNEGRTDAVDVMVVDQTPQGTQLISTTPPVDQQADDGSLVWQLGDIKSGDSRTIVMEIMPLEESEEVGSVARVLFEARASVKTRCTKPNLVIESKGPEQVMVGDDAVLEYTIINKGTGAARNIVILEDVPEGFTHPAGKELEYEIGTLRPNERYPVRLKLRAEQARLGVVNVLRAKGEGQAVAEKQQAIDIVSPQLAVQLNGPGMRYLNRKTKYQAVVANAGTAAAENVDIVVRLPKGVRYVESSNEGQYDDRAHLVYWNVKQLDPQKQEKYEFTLVPTDIGVQRLTVDAQGNISPKVTSEWETKVDGLSELTFSVSDTADPIEFGEETTYEITIQNIGTKSDANINLIVALPNGLQFKEAKGSTKHSPPQTSAEGQLIQFAPIAKMGPNQDTKYRITVTGAAAGGHRIGVQVSSDEAQTPVTREESTRVLPQ